MGFSIKPLDLEMLRRLQHKVNVIPCIAKGDTLTRNEAAEFKRIIRQTLEENNIEYYHFPATDDDDDDDDEASKGNDAAEVRLID